MSFNDNQYFYAALWWMASLPDGARYVDDVCAAHGRARPELRVNSAHGAPLGRTQCVALFNKLYDDLRQGRFAVKSAADGGLYMEVAPDKNSAVHGSMYLHDDGQILVPLMMGRKLKTISQDYPGKPQTDYRLVNLSAENFAARPEFIRQDFSAVSGPFPCIEVTRPLQIGCGDSYVLTAPGDRILWEGAPRIVKKEQLAKGQISLIPALSGGPH